MNSRVFGSSLMAKQNKNMDPLEVISSTTSEDDWEKEDPDSLNNHNYELLFRECEKIPLPPSDERGVESDKEFWETVKVARELLLDQNFVLDILSKKEEVQGSREAAREVVENLVSNYERICSESLETFNNYKNKPCWDDTMSKKIFSSRGTERVTQWKLTLNLFLDSYLKIRGFIPKDSLEEGGDLSEREKEECKYLKVIVESLQTFFESLEAQ